MLVRYPDCALGMVEMGNGAKGRRQHRMMEKGHPKAVSVDSRFIQRLQVTPIH